MGGGEGSLESSAPRAPSLPRPMSSERAAGLVPIIAVHHYIVQYSTRDGLAQPAELGSYSSVEERENKKTSLTIFPSHSVAGKLKSQGTRLP